MATLYPPLLAETQSAFVPTTSYSINFSLPSVVNAKNIGHIQIRIVYQSNNKSAVNTALYPDGIIYKVVNETILNNGVIHISESEINSWVTDTYYKIQLRFGASNTLNWLNSGSATRAADFAKWKAQEVNSTIQNVDSTYQGFGEWSTVMITKCIDSPSIKIANQDTKSLSGIKVDGMIGAETSQTPLFMGYYSSKSYEPVDKYKFVIYEGEDTTTQLLDSGWLQHDVSKDNCLNGPVDSIDTHRFKYALTEDGTYTLIYSIITTNGYETSSESYIFNIAYNPLAKITDTTLSVDDHSNSITANENGCMYIRLTTEDNSVLSGNYVILRTDEYSNFSIWDDLKYIVLSNASFDNTIIYTDYTIESGVKYKYALVKENSYGLRSTLLTEQNNNERWVDFQYSYLFGEGKQLRLEFNNKISSFKRTKLVNKIDTIGSKYPTIAVNGYADYAEFPIEGLISLNMDEARTFITETANGIYYDGEKIISKDKYIETIEDLDINTFNHNLTDNNYYIERKFREAAMDFLNNQQYKVLKSPTEGNILIILTNLTFTPEDGLGRLLYKFSGTAYEVGDATLSNYNDLGIIEVGEYSKNIGDLESQVGQIYGLYDSSVNLISLIADSVNAKQGDSGYQYKFNKIKSISFDNYPSLDFESLIGVLDAQIAQKNIEIQDDTKTQDEIEILSKELLNLQNELSELTDIRDNISSNEKYPLITLNINGADVRIQRNRIYNLSDYELDSTAVIKVQNYHNKKVPLIVNFIAEMSTVESLTETTISTATLSVWGQLGGAFTTKENELNNYNYNRDIHNYLVYNPEDKDSDKYNMNYARNYIIIQSTDILAIIKQQVKKQVEEYYNTEFTLQIVKEQYTDGTNYYQFSYVSSLEIEADEGTEIYLNDDVIRIGKTEKYIIKNLKPEDINKLTFADNEHTFAIINYRCKVLVETKGSAAGGA